MKIIQLTSELLDQAGALANTIFPDNEVLPSVGLAASIDKDVLTKLNEYSDEKFNWLRYWVAIDSVTKDLHGIIGLYELSSDMPDVCWLGWYCVDTKQQKNGTGTKLLKFAINEALNYGKKVLRVYTSNTTSRSSAIHIYQKFGFSPMSDLPENVEDDLLYFELTLANPITENHL